jgi:hypothetical protein
MDLFLSDEVPSPIKKLVADRIREVEEQLIKPVPQFVPRGTVPFVPQVNEMISSVPDNVLQQSPSMQRIMAKNPDLVPPMAPQPTTAAAAAALANRAKMIHRGIMSDKPEPGMSSPRKV